MRPVLLLSLVLALYPRWAAGADDAARSYDCEPLRPVFCRNIHVACAGKTEIPTSPFRVSLTGGLAQVDFEGPEPTLQGQVDGSGDLIIRLESGRSWIRIEPDGRYSHRIYEKGGAAMSQGRCTPRPAP